MDSVKLDNWIGYVQDVKKALVSGQEKLKKLIEEIGENPRNALDWNKLEDAANIQGNVGFFKTIIEIIDENGESWQEIKDVFEKHMEYISASLLKCCSLDQNDYGRWENHSSSAGAVRGAIVDCDVMRRKYNWLKAGSMSLPI